MHNMFVKLVIIYYKLAYMLVCPLKGFLEKSISNHDML